MTPSKLSMGLVLGLQTGCELGIRPSVYPGALSHQLEIASELTRGGVASLTKPETQNVEVELSESDQLIHCIAGGPIGVSGFSEIKIVDRKQWGNIVEETRTKTFEYYDYQTPPRNITIGIGYSILSREDGRQNVPNEVKPAYYFIIASSSNQNPPNFSSIELKRVVFEALKECRMRVDNRVRVTHRPFR